MENQPVTEAPTQPEPTQPTPKNKSWVKWVLLIILAILLSSGATYFFLNQQKPTDTPQTTQPTLTSSPTPIPMSPTPTSKNQTKTAPTSDKAWRGLGVSFTYDAAFSPNKPVSTVEKVEPGGYYVQSFGNTEDKSKSMILATSPLKKKADGSFMTLQEHVGNLQGKRIISVAGQEGLRAGYKLPDNSDAYNEVFYTLLPDKITVVSVQMITQPYSPESMMENASTLGGIISTFKFL